MTNLAVVADYSDARFTPAQLKAAGIVGVVRYVSYGPNQKNITKAEYDELTAGGITVALVFEWTANRALGGQPAGYADGIYVEGYASALGYPSDGAIYYAVDVDTSAASVVAYWQGLARAVSAPHRRRVYHGNQTIDLLVAQGFTDAGWVAAASSWSHGVATSAHATLQQLVTNTNGMPGAWDQDNVLRWDWARITPVVPPAPPAPPKPKPLPAPTKGTTVYNPPLHLQDLASKLTWPHGGVILLGVDGSIYSFDAPFYGAANGQPFFANRVAAQLLYLADGDVAGYSEGYTIVDTAGERYNFDAATAPQVAK